MHFDVVKNKTIYFYGIETNDINGLRLRRKKIKSYKNMQIHIMVQTFIELISIKNIFNYY